MAASVNSITKRRGPERILAALVRRSAIPHAMLFTGLPGVGKRAAAERFAMACNCARPPTAAGDGEGGLASLFCDRCRSCGKIRSASHPDILSVQPSGSLIRIDQIRELCGALSLKPFEARVRVVVISDAQAMNPSAANALLKVLEEPPDRTILILTAEKSSDLLPTVISRCRKIRFAPVSRERLAAWLVQNEGVNRGEARILANLANGSRARAIAMRREGWIHRRAWLLERAASLGSQSLAGRLAFAATLARDPGTIPESLEILMSWHRDLLVCRFAPEKVINQDLLDRLLPASRGAPARDPLSIIEAIHSAGRDIEANGNARLCLETLTMKIAKSATTRRTSA